MGRRVVVSSGPPILCRTVILSGQRKGLRLGKLGMSTTRAHCGERLDSRRPASWATRGSKKTELHSLLYLLTYLRIKQASGCREPKRTPSSRCSNATTPLAAACSSPLSASKLLSCTRLLEDAARGACRRAAHRSQRGSRGEDQPRRCTELVTLARSRQDLGTSHPRVSLRGTTAPSTRRPWPYRRRPPAAVAAVISVCRRRRRPRVCPSSELLLRGSQTTPLKTARWHAAFYPGIVVSSTPRRHTPRRASRRRRHSFDCGGWAQQGVTIGVPSGALREPSWLCWLVVPLLGVSSLSYSLGSPSLGLGSPDPKPRLWEPKAYAWKPHRAKQ